MTGWTHWTRPAGTGIITVLDVGHDTMHIRLLLFARLREMLGSREEQLELAPGTRVDDLLQLLAARGPTWQHELQGGRVVRVALNQEMAAPDALLHDGDEVALFPPVTGG